MKFVWFLVLGLIIFLIYNFIILPILHCFKTAHIRKDNELWLMYYTASEVYRAFRNVFDKSPSYKTWVAVFTFAACEKIKEEHYIDEQKLAEVATHLLSVEFPKTEERKKVIDYYLHGDKSSEFHQAVIRAKIFLKGQQGSDDILHEVETVSLSIPVEIM
jgi:hypothetical protein